MSLSFADLNLDSNIHKAIEACGYSNPTPIQAQAIPEILNGRDLVAFAPTGTGKSAAFLIPMLHNLTLSTPQRKPRMLILTPTRELAAQITQAAMTYGKFMRLKVASLVGGMSYRQQLKDLASPIDIVVATPGRLLDHMQSRKIDLSEVTMLVLDEADRMLDMGFVDDVLDIAKATPASRQTLLFSATMDNQLASIIRQLLKEPVRIEVTPEKDKPALITQEMYIADDSKHKERLLNHFLANGNVFKAIIFSATKVHADYLANQLITKGYAAAPLHGDLKQNVRNRTIEQFRRDKVQYLVATDVAARGIDISDVTHVFNYDLPKFSEDYVHRIGRTGRAGKEGIAISFVLPMDARHLQKIERYTGQKIQAEIIAGLEPTRRLSSSAPQGKGSRRESGGGYGKSKSSGKSFNYNDKPRGEKYGKPKASGSRFEEGRSAPRTEGGRFSERSEGGRSTTRTEGKRFSERSEGRSSERPAGGRFADRSEGGRSAPRTEGGRFSERSEGRRSSERPAGGRFADRSEGGRSVPRTEGGRFSERSEGRRSSERPEGGRFAARSEGGRSTARAEGGRFSERSEGRRSSERPAGGRFADRSEGGHSTVRAEGGRFSERSEGRRSSEGSRSTARPEGRHFSERSEGRSSERPAGGRFADRSESGRSAPRTEGKRFSERSDDRRSSDRPAGGRFAAPRSETSSAPRAQARRSTEFAGRSDSQSTRRPAARSEGRYSDKRSSEKPQRGGDYKFGGAKKASSSKNKSADRAAS